MVIWWFGDMVFFLFLCFTFYNPTRLNEKKMGIINTLPFNDVFRERSKQNALEIVKLYASLKHKEELRILGRQLLRSSTSIAANFRAACRARSPAEHYAKLCIVVEECDETLFWLEMIDATNLIQIEQLRTCQEETRKLLMIFAKTRKKLKPNTTKPPNHHNTTSPHHHTTIPPRHYFEYALMILLTSLCRMMSDSSR